MSYFGPGESLALLVASLVYTAWQARGVREFFEEVGFRLTLMISVLARLPHLPRRRRWTAVQTYQAGIGNLHVVLLVGLFIGMIVSLQTGIELARFGQQAPVVRIQRFYAQHTFEASLPFNSDATFRMGSVTF